MFVKGLAFRQAAVINICLILCSIILITPLFARVVDNWRIINDDEPLRMRIRMFVNILNGIMKCIAGCFIY